jgi:signal peptidase I
VRAAVMIALAYVTFGHVLLPVRGAGPSMEPTIVTGELIFINTLTYRWREPRRGDVVAVRMAGPSVMYVKRLLGLPGDRLRLDGGVFSINDVPLAEPYAQTRDDWHLDLFELGSDEYFVVGDNRTMPIALHEMGKVPRSRLVGTLAF